MSHDLIELSATKLAALIRGRKVSPVEVVEAFLRRIEQINPKLNAIVMLAADSLERARDAEVAIMRGDITGPLHGVPVTIKDTIETEGLKTTCGSNLRALYLPSKDAAAVARLKAGGAIILGKTNVPEMAIPYECDNPLFGRTNNPYDIARTSGGSSGGEAAAISACLSPAGLGSDLSGSIRVPAHFCGIVGLKPTTGRVSSAGHFPPVAGALSLGAVMGPMARHVEDLLLLLNALTEIRLSENARTDLDGCRVATYLNQAHAPVSHETQETLDAATSALSEAGLIVVEEQPPSIERAIDLWPILFSRVAATQLRSFYEGQTEKAGTVARSIIASSESNPLLSLEAIMSAWTERDILREDLSQWMKATPLVIAPVGAVPAFEHGARRVEVDGHSTSVFRAFGYSRAANVLGFPSISVPSGRSSKGLPIGVQIIGRPFEEETVLAAASIIEEALGGWTPPPEA